LCRAISCILNRVSVAGPALQAIHVIRRGKRATELSPELHVLAPGFHREINRSRYKMSTRAAKSVASDEIAAIQDLMTDLEKRLRRLSSTAQKETTGATNDVGDFVSETLERIMSHVRDSATGVTQSVTEEATRLGGDAIKKITDEVEHRPLIMLGIAAGIGFLVGLANRR